MDISHLFATIPWVTTVGASLYIFFKGREDRTKEKERQDTKEYTNLMYNQGKRILDVHIDSAEKTHREVERHLNTVDDNLVKHDKRIRVLESQLVAKEVVEDMLDKRVQPVERNLEKIGDKMDALTKALTESDAMRAMNEHNIMITLSRLEGKLEGSGVLKTKGDKGE